MNFVIEESFASARRVLTAFVAYLFAVVIVAGFAQDTNAQTTVYTNAASDYTFELPSVTWRETGGGDALKQTAEFVYGDRLDGYLRVRKETVEAGTTPRELAFRDQDQTLRFRSAFVRGKEEPFSGKLTGVVSSYEYTAGGKPMTGRIYYLQADPRTIYTLHFTGLRDKLSRIRNQTDIIARTFQRK
ncbi:MAG: hypothetical protein MSG64_19335 [Pyrinomonadaceae bacterium MAG19_C2-C3]|nr:hypothetical protein [Pyrinomonadaceae bacterium MAG19_C2-C3]